MTIRCRAILIDLDNTIYDEMTYVISGFSVVADAVSARSGLPSATIMSCLKAALAAHQRDRTFDRALQALGLSATPAFIAELVDIYRGHQPSIALFQGVANLLARLRNHWRLGIVTDGLGVMQRRKVAALGVDHMVDAVVYCWDLEAPKPAPLGFLTALHELEVPPNQAVIVGDRLDHDIAAAQAIGARSVRVLTGSYAGIPDQPSLAADATIDSITDLEGVISALDEG